MPLSRAVFSAPNPILTPSLSTYFQLSLHFSHKQYGIMATMEAARVSPKHVDQDRQPRRRWATPEVVKLPALRVEFSRKDLTTGFRIAAQENGRRMRRELHTIISIYPPGPSHPRHRAKPTQAYFRSLGAAAWATRSFPPFICSGPPLVVGHPQLNLSNRALGSRGKQSRRRSHPSVFSSVPRQLLTLGRLNPR